ncbi:phosphatase 2C [Thraustotheca clavata]|uniref:Phosphatase 2C n=1 Tax=Thraustotheca clavata TaxID=74557 RepID=A0A1V9YVD4_9STRA|nr:phosphatase 2C [Thraustotheca clavata]
MFQRRASVAIECIVALTCGASAWTGLEPSKNALDVQAARDRIAARTKANRDRAEQARKSQNVRQETQQSTSKWNLAVDPEHLKCLAVDIGASSSIGARRSMEDRSCCLTFLSKEDPVAFVAVYDGHAGVNCAAFLQTALIEQIRASLTATTFSFSTLPTAMLGPLLTQACALADDSFLRSHLVDDSGSCAAFALIGKEKFAVGNIGDSQLILSHKDTTIDLCTLHAPNNPHEKQRIEAAHGQVLNGGRYIFGYLGVSRAFGDRMLKEDITRPIVISQPDVVIRERSKDDEFLLIACDGLFEVFTPESVAEFIRGHLKTMTPAEVSKKLVSDAIANGSQDNVSLILVVFD